MPFPSCLLVPRVFAGAQSPRPAYKDRKHLRVQQGGRHPLALGKRSSPSLCEFTQISRYASFFEARTALLDQGDVPGSILAQWRPLVPLRAFHPAASCLGARNRTVACPRQFHPPTLTPGDVFFHSSNCLYGRVKDSYKHSIARSADS